MHLASGATKLFRSIHQVELIIDIPNSVQMQII